MWLPEMKHSQKSSKIARAGRPPFSFCSTALTHTSRWGPQEGKVRTSCIKPCQNFAIPLHHWEKKVGNVSVQHWPLGTLGPMSSTAVGTPILQACCTPHSTLKLSHPAPSHWLCGRHRSGGSTSSPYFNYQLWFVSRFQTLGLLSDVDEDTGEIGLRGKKRIEAHLK